MGKGQGTGEHILCGSNVNLLFSCCVREKDVTESRSKATGQRVRESKTPATETRLALNVQRKPQIRLLLNIWNEKISQMCRLAKIWTFNKSHQRVLYHHHYNTEQISNTDITVSGTK